MGFGIGRVPEDVDPTDEMRAEIEAAEIMAKAIGPVPPIPQGKFRRCPRCGATGRAGNYPFSTYGALARGERQICDDCGE